MEMSGYVYHCSSGETFDGVARFVYGDEKYAAELMCANPEYDGETVFAGGEDLLLPLVYIPPEDGADLEPQSEKAPWEE